MPLLPRKTQDLARVDSIANADVEAAWLEMSVEREVTGTEIDYDVVAADGFQGERWEAAYRDVIGDAVLGAYDNAPRDGYEKAP